MTGIAGTGRAGARCCARTTRSRCSRCSRLTGASSPGPNAPVGLPCPRDTGRLR